MINDATTQVAPIITVERLVEYLGGTRFAIHVQCDDGHEYALKGIPVSACRRMRKRYYGRELFIEQVVGTLAVLVSAPVPPCTIVQLPGEFIQDGTWIRCLSPGPCHGVRWVDNSYDERDLSRALETSTGFSNRDQLANLAVLLGWFTDSPSDSQYLVEDHPPYRVFSVDHGLIAGTSPIWEDVMRDEWVRQSRRLRPHFAITQKLAESTNAMSIAEIPEVYAAGMRLESVSDESIAKAIAAPPNDWGVGIGRRIALMRYLQDRRDRLAYACKDQTKKTHPESKPEGRREATRSQGRATGDG